MRFHFPLTIYSAAYAGIAALNGESGHIMDTEKKYRIHFPLAQISSPIVTHLVNDYDLSPNLLRADVDIKKGGWLVIGLVGEESKLESALGWMRGQGLGVEEE